MPHGTEVMLVGEQADGADDFAAQDAARGLSAYLLLLCDEFGGLLYGLGCAVGTDVV
ncbi:hypothetical protein ACWCQZ_43720 [Streptomyces sp. NPDC002285]